MVFKKLEPVCNNVNLKCPFIFAVIIKRLTVSESDFLYGDSEVNLGRNTHNLFNVVEWSYSKQEKN